MPSPRESKRREPNPGRYRYFNRKVEEDKEASEKLGKRGGSQGKRKLPERINGQFIQMRAEKMPTGFDSHVLGDIIKRGQNVEARPHMNLGINGQYILPRSLAITCSPESERKRAGDGGGRRV